MGAWAQVADEDARHRLEIVDDEGSATARFAEDVLGPGRTCGRAGVQGQRLNWVGELGDETVEGIASCFKVVSHGGCMTSITDLVVSKMHMEEAYKAYIITEGDHDLVEN